MSTNDNKRKPTDKPESLPAPKHLKIDESTMASVPPPRQPPAQQEITEAIMAFPGWPPEVKRKYISGIESLRQVVESKGINTQEGQLAQTKMDKILSHLRGQMTQRQQQQQHQMQQAAAAAAAAATMGGGVSSGTVSGVAGVGDVTAPTGAANNIMAPTTPSRWIPPAGMSPQEAEKWKADIGTKLTEVGHKLAAAKSQVREHHAALDRGGHTPEAEVEIRTKLQVAQTNFQQCKDILAPFYRSQKQMQAQQQQLLQQGQQPQLLGGAPIHPGGGGPQQTRPMQPQQTHHPQQGGMGAAHQQPQQQNMQGRPPQQPPMPQPLPPPQIQPQQPQTQQMPQQQQAGAPVQRASTPVDQTRAGSPANVNSHVTSMNQARQQPAMSPNQSNMQLQNQQQHQGQTPQQQAPRAPQNMVLQQQQQAQVQAQAQAMGRSPAPTNAGTPMAVGPNSPAPRPGSAQAQQPGRPQTATSTPVQGQPPQFPQEPGQQPHPQQQQQQQQRHLPPGQMLPAAPTPVQRENTKHLPMPIPTHFSLPHPVPVSIPAGRPSLTGGANTAANSVLGTPAIIKQPAFEFDEGGMGLLSKRKLEELVKQIDPEEKLDPDVEEVTKTPNLHPLHICSPL